MGLIDIDEVTPFLTVPVQVAVKDTTNEAIQWSDKVIQRAETCPDGTHLRLYFDLMYFLAVPLSCNTVTGKLNWTAYDEETELYYLIRKEDD